MKVTSSTKISALIKADSKSIEAIASINPHFGKLKNPVLRKILAPRVTIRDAARIGKCKVEDIYKVLLQVGFEIGQEPKESIDESTNPSKQILDAIEGGRVQALDVRPILKSGKDPFNMIMSSLKELSKAIALEVISDFEPSPLIRILEKKGYSSWVKNEGDTVKTYFLPIEPVKERDKASLFQEITEDQFERLRAKYNGRTEYLDVSKLEMPLPMVKVLEKLSAMNEDQGLLVVHRKIPHFLFEELEDLSYDAAFHKKADEEVNIFIFRR